MRSSPRAATRALIACLGPLALGACAVGPDYAPPIDALPAAYKENPGWKTAEPADGAPRGAWWALFKDPTLDALEAEVGAGNQSLKAAEAAYRQARAVLEEARASFWPSLSAQGSAQRQGQGSTSQGRSSETTTLSTSVSGSWEIDLWGRIARSVESNRASLDVSAADLANARLSAQAQLAQNYFSLRATDAIQTLLDASVDAYAKTLEITRNRYAVGLAGKSDVVQATAQLENTRSQAIAVAIQRAQYENAIAVLIGKSPSEFRIERVSALPSAPAVPAVVPSRLLERRPDIASLERRMAAANAQIGLSIAGFFPDISLTGSYGVTGTSTRNLFSADDAVWSFGPKIAQLIFDGGLKWNQVKASREAYNQTVANYRLGVLTALGQVENQLVSLRTLARQAEVEDIAAAAAEEAERLVINQYKVGTVAYTSVLTAQTTALSSKQSVLTIRRDQLNAAVALIQALGGGWDRSQLAAPVPDAPDSGAPDASAPDASPPEGGARASSRPGGVTPVAAPAR